MAYELISFLHQSLLTHQQMSQMADNDDFIKTAFSDYHRPNLVYSTPNIVGAEENTGTANQTKIAFSDGDVRTVTDPINGLLRGCDLNQSAQFASGTPRGGIHSNYSKTNNRWYHIFAVKVTTGGHTDKFVLVAHELAPDSPANVNTLITDMGGIHNFHYLGIIRNGDSDAVPDGILNFKMSGGITLFRNPVTGDTGINRPGILLATVNGGTQFLTYTYAAGVGDLQIPSQISHAVWSCACDNQNTEYFVSDQVIGARITYRNRLGTKRVITPASWGVQIDADFGAGRYRDITLAGFVDGFFAPDVNKFLGHQ